MAYTFTVSSMEDLLAPAMAMRFVEEIVIRIAEEYQKDFGPEILKRIQEKTIEAKVIQKVIENLKKELREEKK